MLTVAEVNRQEKWFGFASSPGGEVCAWVHRRGCIDKASTDGGHDLVVMVDGGSPQVVISGAKSLSAQRALLAAFAERRTWKVGTYLLT